MYVPTFKSKGGFWSIGLEAEQTQAKCKTSVSVTPARRCLEVQSLAGMRMVCIAVHKGHSKTSIFHLCTVYERCVDALVVLRSSPLGRCMTFDHHKQRRVL